MTRHETISAAALQARTLELAGTHAVSLLTSGAGATLAAQLEDLAALGPVALLQVIRRFGLSPLDTDLLCLVAALNALGYTLADRTTRYQEALELIDRARAAAPEDAAIIDSYGWVLYRLGRNAEALVELRRAFTLQKDAEIAAHVAEVLWVMGQKDEARRFFEEARKIDPDNRSLQRALEKTGA